jgi:translation initiation factor IF-2
LSNPKVFEYAKEIGMTPLALMDKIREWKLPVKSHMAELNPDVMAAIETKLKGDDGEEATGKKAAPKKKAAAKKTKAPAKAGAKTAKTKSASPAKVATKATSTKAAAAKAEAGSAAAKPAGTVVRRKTKVVEEAPPEVVEEAPTETPEAVEAVAETKAAPVEAPVEKVQAAAAAPAPEVEAPKTEAPAAPAAVVPARKKEVAIGNSGVASAPPRRNIIGRMDLGRVAQNQGQRGGPDRGGPRPPIGGAQTGPMRSKGNLRTGFVQAQTPETLPPVDDFDRRRGGDDKRRAKPGAAGDATAVKPAGEEGQKQHFDAAEFRKREMVFQPKKKKGMLNRPSLQTQITKAKASKRIVEVNQTKKLSDLAMDLGVKAPALIKVLMKNGVMATINMDLDFDTIALIVPEFGFEATNVFQTAEEFISETAFGDLEATRVTRPPVVTIMGHVDHGKTSLLDAIRNANVASGEAGGITQHIGAYQVTLESGSVITFLDTPGHEAFTAMRARGANVTDIAVIVVAADDGVMPQTAEAISHAKAANVPMIVAVNKIDKPGANPEKIKQQLTEYEVVPEEWGGTTMFVNVSAVQKTGIKELLEQIHLLAEVGELKANPERSGTGTVIESKLEKGRGNVATILVKDGTVKIGQHIVAGSIVGKIKSLTNDKGERVESAGPGMPVEVLGLDGTPLAGDTFDICKDEKSAEEAARIRKEIAAKANQVVNKVSLEDLFAKVKQGDVKDLDVVLKSDVTGSMEAINGMFKKLTTPEVKVKVIHSAVGGITESDVLLASTSQGIIVGFNVRPDSGAIAAAKRMGVEIRTYSIVYEMMDDMKKAMAGMLTPDIIEKVLGRAEVRNTFTVPKIGTIAGCFVIDGKIQRSNQARLIRDGKIVYEGKISSLKRFKDDAKEVAQGFECGIGIENFNDVKVGDQIEAFVKEEVARELTLTTPAEA